VFERVVRGCIAAGFVGGEGFARAEASFVPDSVDGLAGGPGDRQSKGVAELECNLSRPTRKRVFLTSKFWIPQFRKTELALEDLGANA